MYPHDRVGRLTTWVGVGGSPESVVRAARYGLPLMLAIIGGSPARFAPLRRPVPPRARRSSAARRCRSACTRPATSPTPTSRRATSSGRTTRCMQRPHRRASAAGRPIDAASEFEREAGPDGALYVGSPETVAAKIADDHASRSASTRFDLKYSAGTLPHEQLMRSIELYGTKVVPRVRELLGRAAAAGRRGRRARRRGSADAAASAEHTRLTRGRPGTPRSTRSGRSRAAGGAPPHGGAEPRGIGKSREERARDDRDQHVARSRAVRARARTPGATARPAMTIENSPRGVERRGRRATGRARRCPPGGRRGSR